MDGSIAIGRVMDDTGDGALRPLPARPDGAKALPARALARLYFAIEAAREGDAALIVQFIGVDGGEGVSSVAAGYVAQASRVPDSTILVVRGDASGLAPGAASGQDPGLIALFRAGRPLRDALVRDARAAGSGQVFRATLGETAEREADPRLLAALTASLRREFSLVVLDCPPLGRSPLSGALSRVADGTVLVLQAGRTRRRAAARVAAEIGGLGGQVVGLVLNRYRDWLPPWLRRRMA